MKYKLLRFSLLSVLVMLFGGGIYASFRGAPSNEAVYTFNPVTSKSNTDYTKNYDVTINSIDWSLPGNQATDGQLRIGGKSLDKVDRTMYTKTAIDKAVGKLTFKHKGVSSDKLTLNSVTLVVASDAAFTEEIETIVKDNLTIGKNTEASFDIEPTSGSWPADSYYKIVYNVTNSIGSNYAFQLTSIVFYGVADASDTRTATIVELTEGYATTGEVGGRIALPRYSVKYGDGDGSVLESATVTWESSDTDVAIIDAANSLISLKAAGTTTIKATYAGDETYKPSTASYTLTVTPQTVNITSLRELQNRVTTTSTPANITFRDIQVVYVNGSNAFLADANGYGALIYTKDHGLEAGQVLNGTIKANIVLYQGNAEITDFSKEGLTITEAEVTPTVTTISAITTAKQNTLVTLKKVTASVSADGNTIMLADGDNKITFYDKFKTNVTIEDGKTYDITGVIVIYNETIEICPRTADDVAEAQAQEPEQNVYRNFAVNLTNTDIFDTNNTNFGVKVAEDGTYAAVAADDATANFVMKSARWNDKQHGWVNCEFTIPVPGPVKIELGDCQFGGQNGTIVDALGNSTEIKATAAKSCWNASAPHDKVVVAYYAGTAATTLKVTYNGYCPFIAVTSIDASEIPNEATLTFVAEGSEAEGIAPVAQKVAKGEKVKIPANTTLYKEGYTLTAWTDGTNQYKAGDEITLAEDITLTPVFAANEVTLADRTSTVHLEWPLGEASGAGKINYQGNKGVVVCQTIVNEKKIDVKMDIDATSGKINNVGRGDKWAQVNAGTKFTIPSCKGAYFTTEAHKDITTTTIDGKTDYTPGTNIEYTVTSNAETIDIVIGDGEYYSIVKIDLPVVAQEESKFIDIKADFTYQSFFTATDTEVTRAGLKMNEDGTFTRVAVDDETANAIIMGKYHSDEHGISNFMAMVDVEGPVKITMGTCQWGGDVTVQTQNEATLTTIGTFNTNTGACYHNDKEKNVVSYYYKQGEATTLRISGGSYVPYFAVEKVDPKDIPSDVKFTFDITGSGAEGVAPADETVGIGKKYTLPKNFTLYKEGATLTGWTDGTNTYAPGEEITAPDAETVALTPVFTENTVTLADRTEAVTLKWNFRRDAGAPTVAYQNATGIWVAQATIDGKVIDVKADFDTNNGGKFANGNWTDWAQLNSGTKWTIPSCKGAVVSIEAYSAPTTTTIDGQTDYTTNGNTISYTIAGAAETVDVVIGDGSYYRYIQVVLPVVQSQGGGKSFDNAEGTIAWALGNEANGTLSESINGAIISSSVSTGADLTVETAKYFDTDMVKYTPKTSNAGNVEGVMVEYRVKAAKGVTFKPTKIDYAAVKVGTDNASYSWSYTVDGVESAITAIDPKPDLLRNNGSNGVDNGGTAKLMHTETFTVDPCNEFTFRFYISACGNTKNICIGNITITGIANGETVAVEMFKLTTASTPEGAGSVSVYPVAEEYEAGSEVTLTATENFGYDFVNWTNAAGEEVSAEAKFKYTMTADETLTANFKAVETYELALTVDGTNDYMVTINPAPTMVEGKMMYEAGTTVELNANQYDGLVTFTNWSDGETTSKKLVKMEDNVTLTAAYTQADIIAGWDFYKKGGEGRKADFAGADNEADALSLVETATGNTSGWLDKSTEAAGGYESFKGAAVNWRTGSSNGDVGNWHWQTKVNAEAFTNITVQFQMLYNYNAYQKYNAEFSTDGETWTNFGSITMEKEKAAASFNETLPEAANNQKDLFIRMIADKTSEVKGAASANDGNTLAMFFITGTPKLVDDPVAPALVSSVPVNGATGASATGKIVLNFDKKVQVAESAVATLGTMKLTPAVNGKVITFEYKGLEYSTEYTFNLPANTVQNLTGATLAEAITIKFTTMARPTITKGAYDAVVSNVEELVAAINAAESRADKNVRFRIFIKNGEYTIPLGTTTKTVNNYDVPECITFIKSGNISFIGESRDGVIITNGIQSSQTFEGQYGTTSKYDGIGNSDVFQISGSDYYFQDLTVETGMDDATGRDLAIHDKATRTIYKNTGLRGYQDTWTSNNDRGLYYFEGGYVRGRTDYMCGKGDAFFNGVELRQIAGGYAAVPSKPANIGWVYKDCVINGEGAVVKMVNGQPTQRATAEEADGKYTLGRPWGKGTPVAVFIDTKMNVVPSAIGWNEMSGGFPKRFAEWNSTTSTGSSIDLSGRKTAYDAYDEYNKETGAYVNRRTEYCNPVLSAEEALEYSDMSKMFGEWEPTLATEQAPVPANVTLKGNALTWDSSDYALLWAVVKNDAVVGFVTEPTFTVDDNTATWAVRAANEMGGLSEATEATVVTGIETITTDEQQVKTNDNIYNMQGIRVQKAQKGLYIVGGKKIVVK